MSHIAQRSALIIRFSYFKNLLTGFLNVLRKIEERTIETEGAMGLGNPVFQRHIDELATLWYHSLNTLNDHMRVVHTLLAQEELIPPEAITRGQIDDLIWATRLPLETIKHRLEIIGRTERIQESIVEPMDALIEVTIGKTRYMRDRLQWYRRLNVGDRITAPYQVRDAVMGSKWREGKQKSPVIRKATGAYTYRVPCDPPAGFEGLGKPSEEKLPPKFADFKAFPFTTEQLEYLMKNFVTYIERPATSSTIEIRSEDLRSVPRTKEERAAVLKNALKTFATHPTRAIQNVTFEIQDDHAPNYSPKDASHTQEIIGNILADDSPKEAPITRPATAESITQTPEETPAKSRSVGPADAVTSVKNTYETRGKMNERIARLVDNADRVMTFLQDVRYPLGSVRQIADVAFSETTLQGFDDLQSQATALFEEINEGLPQPTEISVRMQQKQTEILNFLRELVHPDKNVPSTVREQYRQGQDDIAKVFDQIATTAYNLMSYIERE